MEIVEVIKPKENEPIKIEIFEIENLEENSLNNEKEENESKNKPRNKTPLDLEKLVQLSHPHPLLSAGVPATPPKSLAVTSNCDAPNPGVSVDYPSTRGILHVSRHETHTCAKMATWA